MAQTIPSFPLSVIDNLVSDISKLIDEHQLGDETLDNAPMFRGGLDNRSAYRTGLFIL